MRTQREHHSLASHATLVGASLCIAIAALAATPAQAMRSSASFSISADGVVPAAGSASSTSFSLKSTVIDGVGNGTGGSTGFSLLSAGPLTGAVAEALTGEDTDEDGVSDRNDNCDFVQNEDQEDFDGDGLGDACDPDDDNDLVVDGDDAFPNDPAASVDTDGDGDPDDFNDTATRSQIRSSNLVVDTDDDGDGVRDRDDAFPQDPAASVDTDGDGKPDSFDEGATPEQIAASSLMEDDDDDGDGLDDGFEEANGLNPKDRRDAGRDADRDDFTNLEEQAQGTDLNDRDSWPMPTIESATTFDSHTGTIEWDFPAELPVRRWQVYVGTTEGGRQIFSSPQLQGDVRQLQVSRLPTDGSPLFVTLRINRGEGFRNSKTFAFNAVLLDPPTLSPDTGVLGGVEQLFELDTEDNDVTQWRVEASVLSSSGRDQRVFRRTARPGDTEMTVTGLPTFGEPVVVKFDYRLSGRAWQTRRFEFQGATLGAPELVSPLPDGSPDQLTMDNSVHPRDSVEFTWTANGQPVNRWKLWVGTTRGGRDRFARTLGRNATFVDTRKLFDASPLYVRLFYRVGRVERHVDYLYHPLDQTLRPYYAAAEDLGLVAPIRNDGEDRFSASGKLCRGNERPNHEACLPGGLMKVMTLPSSVTSCDNVTATDLLGAFEWVCRQFGDTVEVVSVDLDGPIADLIDTSIPGSPAFKANQVIVEDDGVEVARSGAADETGMFTAIPTVWWTTPVVTVAPPAPEDTRTLLRDRDTVYVLEQAAHGVPIKLDRARHSVLVPVYAGSDPVTGAGEPGSILIDVSRAPFAVVTGDYALTGEETAVRVDRSPFAQVLDADILGDAANTDIDTTPELGLHVLSSNNVLVDDVTVAHANAIGVYVERSKGVWVEDANVVLNGEGVVFNRASGNGLHHARVAHNTLSGVLIERGSDNHLAHLVVSNNGTAPEAPGEGHGIEVFHSSSQRNHIAFAQVFNNAGHGVVLDGAKRTLIEKLTVFNHPRDGLFLDRTDTTTVLSTASLNNGEAGLNLIDRSRRTQVRDLVSAHNATGVRMVERSIQNTFSGLLTLGGNGLNCEVGPNSRDLAADCTATGNSDHTLVTGVDAANSLVGKVTTDGPNGNGSADHDTELVTDVDALIDVGDDEGETLSRGWGRDDGNAFPHPGHQGPCMSGETCRIWSGAAAAGDTGNGGGPVLAEVLAIPGNEDVVQHRFRSIETFLEHASEVMDDGIGNDNGRCESGEACHLDLNIGAWQGNPGDSSADATIGFDLVPRTKRDPPAVEDVDLDARDDTTVGGGT